MNNEPVAWMRKTDITEFCEDNIEMAEGDWIPLYTHPHSEESVKAKTLTDEEIDYCWSHSHGNTPWMKQKAFARAILRKAQDK